MEPNYLVLLGIVIVIIGFALKLDAILIIMASVDDGLAAELEDAACHWGMDALIEVHDRAELDRALRLKSPKPCVRCWALAGPMWWWLSLSAPPQVSAT